MNIAPGPLEAAVESALAGLENAGVIERIWAKDHTVWMPESDEIANRLGWLHVAPDMRPHLKGLKAFAEEVRGAGFSDVVLLGMGGSSLGAEALQSSFAVPEGYPRLKILDSTVPAWVDRITRSLDPGRSLFLVASKSGTTHEVMAFFNHFWALAEASLGKSPGKNFAAITDADTSLARSAKEKGFRRVFLNPSDIGGRYSVLSFFGLLPAALGGLPGESRVGRAEAMARACGAEATQEDNPGLGLGAFLGAGALEGRDKVTLLISPRIATFGLWVEQLIAESTGKGGRGILPVVGEPFVGMEAYGRDRTFVSIRLAGDDNEVLDGRIEALRAVGQPLAEIALASPDDLGGEFFRWELATAVAGHLLGINPFDQPDVQASKTQTRQVLASFLEGGKLPGVAAGGSLSSLLAEAGPGSYAAIMAYTDASIRFETEVEALRRRLLQERRLPTTFGYGPRFLHSTGQLHKGDAGNGVFVQVVAQEGRDLPVPGESYTFGVLAAAQALADFQTLEARGRKVVRLDLGDDPATSLRAYVSTQLG